MPEIFHLLGIAYMLFFFPNIPSLTNLCKIAHLLYFLYPNCYFLQGSYSSVYFCLFIYLLCVSFWIIRTPWGQWQWACLFFFFPQTLVSGLNIVSGRWTALIHLKTWWISSIRVRLSLWLLDNMRNSVRIFKGMAEGEWQMHLKILCYPCHMLE